MEVLYVETVKHDTENQKGALFHFHPEIEIGHSNTHRTISKTFIKSLPLINIKYAS